jgi:hypothetical protein
MPCHSYHIDTYKVKSYRPKIKREKTIQDNEYNSGLAV